MRCPAAIASPLAPRGGLHSQALAAAPLVDGLHSPTAGWLSEPLRRRYLVGMVVRGGWGMRRAERAPSLLLGRSGEVAASEQALAAMRLPDRWRRPVTPPAALPRFGGLGNWQSRGRSQGWAVERSGPARASNSQSTPELGRGGMEWAAPDAHSILEWASGRGPAPNAMPGYGGLDAETMEEVVFQDLVSQLFDAADGTAAATHAPMLAQRAALRGGALASRPQSRQFEVYSYLGLGEKAGAALVLGGKVRKSVRPDQV